MMISKLIRRRRTPLNARDATIPPHQRIYAVGDIHGRLDLLDKLLGQIDADDRARPKAETRIIFLGDLVDRGPASAGVVQCLMDFEATRPAGSVRFLLGNHEEILLDVLTGDERALRLFLRVGGRETVLSYGMSPEVYRELDYSQLLTAFRSLVPEAHRAFLAGFEDLIIIGDYAFVHAGIRPGEALARQRAKDLRWIRSEFLNHQGEHEKIVVHGHSVTDQVDIQANRIGLDTGAFASGRLTAMGFEANRRWVLQTDSTS